MSGREIWIRGVVDIVIKYDYKDTGGFSGNSREESNFLTYKDNSSGVYPCFPVWGVTERHKFLVMARAEAIPLFGNSEELKNIARKVSGVSGSYVPDPSIQNMGFITVDGCRYWATVDMDFSKVEFYVDT